MTYLVRSSSRKRGRDVVVVEDIDARYARRHRPTGKVLGGLFREVEDAGQDKSRLRIIKGDELGHTLTWADNSAAGVKKVMRKLRSQEAEILAEQDAKIADLERQVRIARAERQQFLQEAFSKGNVVPLKDVVALAENRK